MIENSNRRRSATLALACASVLCAAGAARAEEQEGAAAANPVELEEIVVSGFRVSLETSINAKREAVGVLESVSAEEIGKLPDVSVAEAIARLPGLAAQRVDGRAQVISIRGMAPKYAVTLLNGREMVSTGDNRSFEYDQFPSELINTATVYKSADAGLVAQGLSGTVNLASVRPLDYSDRQMSFSLRGEKNASGELNADSSDMGSRISFSYVDQFAEGTIGLALGYAHLDNPGQEKYYKSWWWANTGNWGSQITGLPPEAIALQGFEAGVKSTDRARDGLMAVLEFKPNENLHSIVDLYYSKFEQTSIQRELQASLTTWDGAVYTDAVMSEFRGDTIATGGDITNVRPVALNRYNDRSDDVLAAGWRTDWTLDDWTLTADLSYSQASRDEINSELTAGALERTGFESISVELTDNGVSHFPPMLDYADPSIIYLSDPAGWGRDGRASIPKVDDEMSALALSAERRFEGTLTSLEFGASYSDRSKDMNRSEVYYYLQDDRTPVTLADGDLVSPSAMNFAGIPGVISFKFNRVLDAYYDEGVPAALDQAPGRIWGVDEKITRGFAKLNFDWEGAVRLRGNLGLQYVYADQQSNGQIWDGSATVPMTGGTTYDDFLPSLNVAAELTEKAVLRVGLAKELARPNMEDMRAGFSNVSVSATPPYVWSANGGNPWLEPWRANAADVSFEYYLGKRSYFAAAWFYKDLESFVYTQTIDYDFTGFPNPGPNEPDSNIGNLSTQANGEGGYVRGVEFSLALDAGLFWEPMEGFGLVGSYSKTESNLHEENNPSSTLDGLSGDVSSIVLYYERGGWSLRLGQRYRSEYETTVRGTFGENVPSAIGAERIVDAQAGYAFTGGKLDGLSILFQVNNLNDEPYRTAVGVSTGSTDPNATLPERYNTYGRQYLLDFTYKR
jgi:iron complex outermembrane receptor protein